MTSNSGHYDQNLLSQTAPLTKQQLQEGYQTDLLNDPPAHRSPSSPSPLSRNNTHYGSGNAGVMAATSSKERLANSEDGVMVGSGGGTGGGIGGARDGAAIMSSSQRHTPFWRTRGGIATMVLALLVIIGVAVGVGVGVGVKHNSSGSNRNSTSTGLDTGPTSSGGLENPSKTPFTPPQNTDTGSSTKIASAATPSSQSPGASNTDTATPVTNPADAITGIGIGTTSPPVVPPVVRRTDI
ncbi:hypothetical protein K435DRAFT_961977 [Dendrothele bispora CBS 962.96]|uniref:Uncharacterized protein n=1 Tax=Dendrothele bispora (strain CBS 962.96) TaxID=1314807 RepID=A0A4S8MNQ6_DENBC|nr:hypothetical protein K435DRAFT_961977 [Dendrothele bispora CBS 962.96]